MKKSILSLIALFLMTSLFAQNDVTRGSVQLQFYPFDGYYKTATLEIPIQNDGPFFSYYIKSNEQLDGLRIRFANNSAQWSDWLPLNPETHMQFEDDSWISELGFEETGAVRFQIASPVNYTSVDCFFYNPKHTEEVHSDQENDFEVIDRSCPCPMPDFQTRSQWCPAGNCFPHPNPSYTNVTHLIIHHSAGTNSSSDWAGVVRAIWDFHVNGNGWSDIGYNWLIDPNGVVYEGRGDNILGAHFCSTNGGTVGTCVMGNFTSIVPATDAINSLVDLYSWKSCDKGFGPLESAYHNSSGLTLKRISGHRDGCATQCPGNSFYPLLPEVRQQIYDHILSGCSGLAGPTGLAGVFTGDTEATLTWEDNSDEELGFLLEKKGGAIADFQHYATIDADVTEFIDDTVDIANVYTYRLRSFTETDTTDYSNEAVVADNVSTNDPFVNQETIFLYPNPASSYLNIVIDNNLFGEIDIEVLDLLTKSAQRSFSFEKGSFKQLFKLDLGSLPAGVYLVNIQQEEHTGLFRVVVD